MRVLLPAVVSVSAQLPSVRLPEQVSSPPLAVILTVPVGVPAVLVTLKATITTSPGAEGSGASAVMLVFVAARWTVTDG